MDRHLLGLRLCLQGTEKHQLFSHPLFSKSSRWQLSTSALTPSDRILGTGFGAAYPDGYGMNYSIGANIIKIGVESKVSCKETSSLNYLKTLDTVFQDMKKLCELQSESKL